MFVRSSIENLHRPSTLYVNRAPIPPKRYMRSSATARRKSSAKLLRVSPIQLVIALAKLHELCNPHRACMLVKPCGDGSHCDRGSFFDGIAIHAGADGRETDGLNVAFGS